MTTSTVPGPYPPVWTPDDLPPVLHKMTTRLGIPLVVRLVNPGDALGLSARLDGTPLVEVRIDGSHLVLAVWDLTLFIEEPTAVWHILTEGMTHAVPVGDLFEMYAAVHDAVLNPHAAG